MSRSLWFEEVGARDAPLVVLVHGTMDRSAGLLKLSRRLHEQFRVLRYDRRGYGRSAPHRGPFTMDRQVDDLVELIDGRRAVLFGHSYGGDVALAVAQRHPTLVPAVVVYETPLSWLDWWPATTAGGTALAVDGDAADAAERFMRRLIGDERWGRLPSATRAARRAEGPAMVGELRDLTDHAPWQPAGVRQPVRALRGEHGAAHHRQGIEYLGANLPNCTVGVVAGARHFGPNTHPDAVAAEIVAIGSLIGHHDEHRRDRAADRGKSE